MLSYPEDSVRELAYGISRASGSPTSFCLDHWLAAKYVFESNEADRVERAEFFAPIYGVFQSEELRQLIEALAYYMWDDAGRPANTALDFWISAHRHGLAIAAGAIVNALADAANGGTSIKLQNSEIKLKEIAIKLIEEFPVREHLAQIRRTAFYLWQASSGLTGGALDYWLVAENRILDEMRRPTFSGVNYSPRNLH